VLLLLLLLLCAVSGGGCDFHVWRNCGLLHNPLLQELGKPGY
jgi:hypothetical protein